MAEPTNGVQTATTDSIQLIGTVLSVQANYYWVQLDPQTVSVETETASLLCTRRARLKKIGQRVIVGDRVVVEEADWVGGRGAIAQILERQTELDRPPIANVDQILLVFALAEPMLDPLQLSRFLIKAESTELAVALCLNKSDLVDAETRADWRDRIQEWGYQPIILSLQTKMGLDFLQTQLSQQTTVVSGPSGVGKSSLINTLIPDVDLRTGAVSGKLGRGRHTTRHVELFELPQGGLLADTPGFNQPDIDCDPQELGGYFPEVRHRLTEGSCQFNDCLHRDEPNCAVRGNWERYDHYLTFLEEAIARQSALEQLGDAESTTKTKVGAEGQVQTEPKLATKKYRRPSRRSQRQSLQDLCQDVESLLQSGELDEDE